MKTKKYNQFFEDANATRILREMINKTFVSSHDFDTTYHELYKTDDGKYFSAVRIDPAPGGYGEEFMYIREVYELEIDVTGKSYSDEELMELVFSEGKKMELNF